MNYLIKTPLLCILISFNLMALDNTNQVQNKNKGSEYEKASLNIIEKFLKTKDSIKQADKKAEENSFIQKSIKNKVKYKAEELDVIMLPVPLKSLIINDKIIVFAEYREKILLNEAKPSKGEQLDAFTSGTDWKTDPLLIQAMEEDKYPKYAGINSTDIAYDKKTIKLRVGDRFGNYLVKSLSSSVVIYQHINQKNKYIKKFY